MIVADISVAPIGEGTSLSRYVKKAHAAIKATNVKYSSGPMSTSFEAENLDQLFMVAKAAHEAVFEAGAKRVVTTLKIDDRRDKPASMDSKLKVLE